MALALSMPACSTGRSGSLSPVAACSRRIMSLAAHSSPSASGHCCSSRLMRPRRFRHSAVSVWSN
jgi:hypothetical protein